MNTTSLASALDSLFGTISTCDSIFAKNGSTKGLISTANLASVLGAFPMSGGNLGSSANLNNKPVGLCTINMSSSGAPSNMPSNYINQSYVFLGFSITNSWGVQVLVGNNGDVYVRAHYTSAFCDWRKI